MRRREDQVQPDRNQKRQQPELRCGILHIHDHLVVRVVSYQSYACAICDLGGCTSRGRRSQTVGADCLTVCHPRDRPRQDEVQPDRNQKRQQPELCCGIFHIHDHLVVRLMSYQRLLICELGGCCAPFDEDHELPQLSRGENRFRGGPVFKAHRLCVSLNSRLKSNKEEEEEKGGGFSVQGAGRDALMLLLLLLYSRSRS